MRVAHFVPAYRSTMHAEVAMGLARDAAWCASVGWDHAPFYADCNGIARARNLGLRTAQANDCDLLLMQDADTFALPTAGSALAHLFRNLRKSDAAVIGAAVLIRNGDGVNCEPATPGEVYDGEVGTGLMLIDLRKLASLPLPWFVQRDTADGCGVDVGEDIGFCRAVKAAGHRVLVDYSIPTGHAFHIVEATRF